MLVLVVTFVVVPLIELFVIFKVASHLGWLETLGSLILVSIVGGWLVKRQGLGVLVRIQRQVANRKMPTDDLLDGALVLVSGALLVAPGFLTDIVGLLLLLPPVRAVARRVVRGKVHDRYASGRAMSFGQSRRFWYRGDSVIDVDEHPHDGGSSEGPRGELR